MAAGRGSDLRTVLQPCGCPIRLPEGHQDGCDGPAPAVALPWMFDDGGRAAAGLSVVNDARDCVCRAIAIGTEQPYRQVYDGLAAIAAERGGRRTARDGVRKSVSRRYMATLPDWEWQPTMWIGSGTTVHLRPGELPDARLIVVVSKHMVAVVWGTAYDNHDPCRGGTRAVYGYYRKVR